MNLVDANIVLRYLLNDHPELSPQAGKILQDQDVFLRAEVFCEVVYVLQKVYGVPRIGIEAQLVRLIDEDILAVENPATTKRALALYVGRNLDIVDALLCAEHLIGESEVFTFDGKLNKCLRQTR